MTSVAEILRKTPPVLEIGWRPEPGVAVVKYKLYCSTVPTTASMLLLKDNISPAVMRADSSSGLGKVFITLTLAEVRAILGNVTFSDNVLYFLLTYVDVGGESTKISSNIVEMPPVGIIPQYLRDDPTTNRSLFIFSHERQKWVKMAGSSEGGAISTISTFYSSNEILEYTYDSSGSVLTTKSYLPDATVSGCPAKLITYTYGNPSFPTKPTKTVVSDSTV